MVRKKQKIKFKMEFHSGIEYFPNNFKFKKCILSDAFFFIKGFQSKWIVLIK